MRLHGYWRSNATYRVRVAMNLKSIAYEEVEHDLLAGRQFDADFLALNPNAAVPALEIDGRVLTQSLAILDYLDTLPGGPRLMPTDAFERAEALALALTTIADAHPLIVPRVRKRLAEVYGADEAGVHDWGRHWLTLGAAIYEKRLTQRPPAPYLFGNTIGLADIAIASHAVASGIFNVELSPFLAFKELADRLLALPEFAAAHPLKRKALVAPE